MTFKKLFLTAFLSIALIIGLTAIFHKPILEALGARQLRAMGYPVKFKLEKLSQTGLNLKDIKIGQNTHINFLKLQYELKPEFNLTSFDINVTKYDLVELKSFMPVSNDSKRFSFEHCEKIKALDLNMQVPGFNQLNLELECMGNQITAQVKDFTYQGMGPFQFESSTKINEEPIPTEFKLSVSNDAVAEGVVLYFQENSEIQVEINKRKDSLQLSQLIEKLAPENIKAQLVNTSGTINFDGKIRSTDNLLGLDLNFIANNVGVETKDYNAKGLRIRHSLIEYPSMKSKKRQSIKAKEITVGATIHDLSVVYEVESTKKVNVSEFKMKFDGAEIESKAFSVYPLKKQFSPTEINVDKLDLEKFLKLALGETATASGVLVGQLKVSFKNNKPVIEVGELKAKGPGRIQYKSPTMQGPPDPDSISADPMVILNSYLYDFHYENLSISMSSNEAYDMKMTLTALGKNPGYMDGMPLKLNINLEQNLLAAFQAMMLSYNLPKRLEEKITNLGN